MSRDKEMGLGGLNKGYNVNQIAGFGCGDKQRTKEYVESASSNIFSSRLNSAVDNELVVYRGSQNR
jgi:hypothetical protein